MHNDGTSALIKQTPWSDDGALIMGRPVANRDAAVGSAAEGEEKAGVIDIGKARLGYVHQPSQTDGHQTSQTAHSDG